MCVDLALNLSSFCFSSYKCQYLVAQHRFCCSTFRCRFLACICVRACVRNEGEGYTETEMCATASIPFRQQHQHQPPPPPPAAATAEAAEAAACPPRLMRHTRSSAQRTFMSQSSESVGSRLPSQCVQDRVLLLLLLLSTLRSVCVS